MNVNQLIHNMLFYPQEFDIVEITEYLYDISGIDNKQYCVDLLMGTIEDWDTHEQVYLPNETENLLQTILIGYTTTDKSCFIRACEHETGITPIVTTKQLIETLNKDIEGEYSATACTRPLCYYIQNSDNWIIVDLLNRKVFFMEPIQIEEDLTDNDYLWQLKDWLNHHLPEEE